jgi:hypothetical protein
VLRCRMQSATLPVQGGMDFFQKIKIKPLFGHNCLKEADELPVHSRGAGKSEFLNWLVVLYSSPQPPNPPSPKGGKGGG